MATCTEEREGGSPPESEDTEGLTPCPICFEVFTEPKYLPCMHTFCEHCLQSYITKIEETEGVTSGFKCPLCRRFVPAPGTVDKASEWASMLPVNNFINTLIEGCKLKSGAMLCQPCQRENESESATTWCKECMETLCDMCRKYHGRLASSKSHEIVPINKVAYEDINFRSEMITCKDHEGKKLEFYCSDHDGPCCITCVTLLHRKCENVDTLEAVAKEFRGKTHVQNILKELNENQAHLKHNVDELSQNVNDLEKDARKISKEIEKVAEFTIHMVSKLKEESISNTNEVKKSNIENLTRRKEEFQNIESSMDYFHKRLSMIERHGSDAQLLLEYKRTQTSLCDLLNVERNIALSTRLSRLSFECNKEVLRLHSNLRQFGETKVRTTLLPSGLQHFDYMSTFPVFLGECRSPMGACVTGILFLPGERILLADSYRPRCLLTNIKFKVLKEKALDMKPRDIELLNSDTAVISFENSNFIQFLDIRTMQLGEKLSTKYVCKGIACNENAVYVSSDKSIHKLDVNRKIDERVASCNNCWHVRVHNTDIIFTNLGNNAMVSTTNLGVVNYGYSHPDLKYPYGLDLDPAGNAYVCGFSSNNVHQVSLDGKQSRVLLGQQDGIESPWNVRFKPGSLMFIVCCYRGERLRFYEMK